MDIFATLFFLGVGVGVVCTVVFGGLAVIEIGGWKLRQEERATDAAIHHLVFRDRREHRVEHGRGVRLTARLWRAWRAVSWAALAVYDRCCRKLGR